MRYKTADDPTVDLTAQQLRRDDLIALRTASEGSDNVVLAKAWVLGKLCTSD